MADIFISYKRDDAVASQRIVRALRASALSVWWDHDIPPGAPWETTIEHELESAKVVIVAWSRASAASENVKAEARRARHNGKLIQVFVEPCDPPLFFGEHQGLKLDGWTGDIQDSRFQTLLAAVHALIDGKAPPQGVGYAVRKGSPRVALAAILVFGIIGGVLGLNPGAVCRLGFTQSLCRSVGATKPPAPATDPARFATDARVVLLGKVSGVWGLPSEAGRPACAVKFVYSVERGGSDDFIRLRGLGVDSVGRVVSAEGGSIFTRTISPASQAGTQWELRLEGDRLIQVDATNVSTTLVRCTN
ncbi:MAG: toll/interleukin-1 receptor domain-containing protein [Caulobacteraceae bacterium]|nr:toll/interleukin-1 receptor domain-containing protein [Caulobacteraceae bacterium]